MPAAWRASRLTAAALACALLTACSSGAAPRVIDVPPLAPPTDLTAAQDTPVEDPYYPDRSNPEVDALHYGLELDWDGRTLHGTSTLVFRAARATATVTLDLGPTLVVSEVTVDGREVTSRRTGTQLVIASGALVVGSRHQLVIRYAGAPAPTPGSSNRRDSRQLGWTTGADGSAHTFQEPWGAYTWYPVNDHPSDEAYYDARITTRAPMRGVFNGRLVQEQSTATSITTRWDLDQPAGSYVMTIAVGRYRRVADTMSDGKVMTYWVRPEDEPYVELLRQWGRRSYAWLLGKLGPYPFSTVGVVLVGGDSAMETQTMITMSGTIVRPVGGGEYVLAHELAHQWFGDDISPRDWTGLWLNEGWAMYWQGQYQVERGFGAPWPYYAKDDAEARKRSGPPGRYDKAHFADNNVYLGPALMLREIRIRVGAPTFGRLVKQWVTERSGTHVTRPEFTQWWSTKSGQNLTPLIDRWLDSTTTPPISPGP